jgi:hypothetical protein
VTENHDPDRAAGALIIAISFGVEWTKIHADSRHRKINRHAIAYKIDWPWLRHVPTNMHNAGGLISIRGTDGAQNQCQNCPSDVHFIDSYFCTTFRRRQ